METEECIIKFELVKLNNTPINFAKFKLTIKSPECECGKEKHGFFAHSDWCPCYSNDVS